MAQPADKSPEITAREKKRGGQDSVPHWLREAAAWGWRFLAVSLALYVLLEITMALWVAVLPVLVAAILASLLEPVAVLLRRWHIPRPVAAGVAVLLGLSALAGAGLIVGFSVAREMDQLTTSVASGYRQLVTWSAEVAGVSPQEVRTWIDRHVEDLQSYAGSVAGQVLNRVQRVARALTVVVVAFVFTWFFTWDGDRQFHSAVSMLPPNRRVHARALGERVWKTVGSYMRGMLVVAAADAILLGLGLWIIRVPLVFPLMILMFVSAFVPFVGPILTGAVACLVALSAGGITKVGLVLLVSLIVQQVEGNFLQPFVMGRAVRLHQAMVLFAITAGGTLGGIVGVFLAIPATASLASILEYARQQRHSHLESA